jgi:hypothetical protein
MPDPPFSDEELDRTIRTYLARRSARPQPPDLVESTLALALARRRPSPSRRREALVVVAVVAAVALVAVAAVNVHLSARHGAVAASPLPSSGATPGPSPNAWRALSLPTGFSATGISCPDAGDCWVIGSSITAGSPDGALAVYRYSDGAWTSVSLPASVGIDDLTCVADDDCWAAGSRVPPAGVDTDGILQPVIEHSTGGPFTVFSSPVMTGLDQLAAVTCANADDCWAVGSYGSQTILQTPGNPNATEVVVSHPLVEHYDGTGWTVVTIAAPAGNSGLSAVTCVSAQDCWAVGGVGGQDGAGGVLLEHYAAGAWAAVSSPAITGNPNDTFSAISCATADDCWVVGSTGGPQTATAPTQQPLVLHYAGDGWTQVPTPEITSANGGAFTGVACTAPDGCWAVGGASGPVWDLVGTPPAGMAQTVIERWTGASWERVTSPQSGGEGSGLSAISCAPATSVCYAAGGSLLLTLTAP